MNNNEYSITNRVISKDLIMQIAETLNNKVKDYQKKFDDNTNDYHSLANELKYEIRFNNKVELRNGDLIWFKDYMHRVKDISSISFVYHTHFYKNYSERKEEATEYIYIYVYEDSVRMTIKGSNMQDEVVNDYNYFTNLFKKCPERYDKTIKYKIFRTQSFCISVGYMLVSIIFLILNSGDYLSLEIKQVLFSNPTFVIIQWVFSIILGNFIGYFIINGIYKPILPKTKYAGYSSAKRRGIYVDDIKDYISKCEVQIGNNANCGKTRTLIEKIFKIAKIIIVIEIIISIIIYFIMK